MQMKGRFMLLLIGQLFLVSIDRSSAHCVACKER